MTNTSCNKYRAAIAFRLCAGLLCAGLSGCCESSEPRARREQRGPLTIVWLEGTAHQMGRQHAELLYDEIVEGVDYYSSDFLYSAMFMLAEKKGLVELARQSSTPEMLQECEGMVEVVGDLGWDMSECLILNFGDVTSEYFYDGVPELQQIVPGCSQFVVASPATADGRLYHGRNTDFTRVDFVIEHPVVFVRRPAGRIPHVLISFPGVIAPYQGINAHGIAVGVNNVAPRDNRVNDRQGISHLQLAGRILAEASSMDEARALVTGADHMSLETIVISDGVGQRAEVLEMAPARVSMRQLADGVLYAANHFVASDMATLDQDPPPESSILRYRRLEQLVPRHGSQSLFGRFDPRLMARVLRDRVNPDTGVESPVDVFSDEQSIATNGALFQMIFDPAGRRFWLAAGAVPLHGQPLVGLSLGELLEGPDAGPVPPTIP